MSGRVRGWLALTWRERGQLLGLLLLLPLIHLAVGTLGYGRTRRWLERRSELAVRHVANAAQRADARRLAQLAEIAGRRGLVRVTCLRQSLLVHALLRRRGLNPELKIGVQRQGDALDAHAWVELEHESLDATASTASADWQGGTSRR